MSLQVWLPFNQTLDNQGLDQVRFNSTNITYAPGKIGYCASGTINGTSTTLNSSRGFSYSLWWNISDGNSYSISIPINNTGKTTDTLYFTKMDYTSQSTPHYAIKLHCDNNEPQMLWIRDNRYTSGVWELGKWHHFIVQVENGDFGIKVAIYIDGALNAAYNNANYNFTLRPGDIQIKGTAKVNDFRLYDHPLTLKEIEELSKGLILHYPLRDSILQNTTNYLLYPTPGKAATPAWDASLHPGAITVSGFSTGYNGGVGSPEVGYHAHWVIMEGVPTMVFPNLNSAYDKKNRWLGISSSNTVNLAQTIGQNNKYTISFEAKASVANKEVHFGLYYRKDGASGNSFHDGQHGESLTTNWKKYSYTWTLSQAPSSDHIGNVYMYGHNGIEGIAYVRNLQLEIGDHATEYVNGNRITSTIYDCSGNGYHGSIVGSISMLPESGRHNYSMYTTDGRYHYVQSEDMLFPTDQITMNCWVKGSVAGYSNYHIPLSFKGGAYELSLEGSTGKLRAGYNVSGTRQVATTSGTTIDGDWHMITSTFDGTTIRRYVDGKEYASTAATGTLTGGTGRLLVGNYNGTTYGNKELYTSDVRIYATALTASQIKELYSIGAIIDKGGNLFGYEVIESGENSVFKEGIVDFDEIIEYNEDRMSENEKVSMFANSVEAYNYYEF